MEEAWNPTNKDNFVLAVLAGLYGHWKRFRGDETEPPILQDALFPSKFTCIKLFRELYEVYPKAKFISHGININYPSDRLLVEVNPGIELSAQEILEKSQRAGFGLVFDPRHLLNSKSTISVANEPTKTYKGEWEKQFNELSSQIEVVDINPPKSEDLSDLEAGKGLLKELAQAAKGASGVKFLRVEIPIPPKWQILGSPFNKKGFDFLQAIGQRLMEG